ncbi:MAG: SRPBCC family protein [Candidatus Dormibacteria bacterium]
MTMAIKGSAKVTLPSDRDILITRHFDAPRHMVWRAYTEPELVARWWHAKRGTVQSIDIDLRVGGTWRYVMAANAGFEVAFSGEYREVVEEERIVSTEVFEGMPSAPATSTVTFEDADGGTTLSILVHHLTPANRDAHLQSGMEPGLQDALDLLEDLASAEPR